MPEPEIWLSEILPAGGGSRPQYAALAAKMRGNRGNWLLVGESEGYSMAGNMNGGSYRAFPKGEFEFKSRKIKLGQIEVWGRYVGASDV